MIRRDQSASRKTSYNEMTQSKRLETGKTRKVKGFEPEIRCQSARGRQRDMKDDPVDTARTRSVSPPLTTELPLKKLTKIYSKVVSQLGIVKKLTECKFNETENVLDLRRQLQRADEFSIRFSRNNLYETKRILNDIKKLIVPYPFENLSPNEGRLLSKKIILGYQAASQSLQIYINYIKNPSNLEVPEKIGELVLLIGELFLCCEHVSLPYGEAHVQNDAVKLCNDLIAILKSKPPIGEYIDIKQETLTKKKSKKVSETEDPAKMKKLSMYKAKSSSKTKVDATPLKTPGLSYILATKAKKLKKKDEKKARITHEIYTQKMNPRHQKAFGSKTVKFEPVNSKEGEKCDNAPEKKSPKKTRFTPREVRSQDDDVETVVQTIEDDELPTIRIDPGSHESNDESDGNNFNKSSFRELLLEAIQDLQCSDKADQKETLKKLLSSIQNITPRAPAVKVFHFKHREADEEEDEGKGLRAVEEDRNEEDKQEGKETYSRTSVSLKTLVQENKAKDDIVKRERRLKVTFNSLKGRRRNTESTGEILPKGKIKLKLSEDARENISRYKNAFENYMKNNIMYKKTQATRPWELVEKVSDHIILDIIRDIAADFESDAILKRLYFNELLEVVT